MTSFLASTLIRALEGETRCSLSLRTRPAGEPKRGGQALRGERAHDTRHIRRFVVLRTRCSLRVGISVSVGRPMGAVTRGAELRAGARRAREEAAGRGSQMGRSNQSQATRPEWQSARHAARLIEARVSLGPGVRRPKGEVQSPCACEWRLTLGIGQVRAIVTNIPIQPELGVLDGSLES